MDNTSKTLTTITIRSFRPLLVELPEGDPIPAGKLQVVLPCLRVVWGALDLLPEAKAHGELPGLAVTFTLPEATERSQAAQMVAGMADQLAEIHRIAQAELDKRGQVFAQGKLPAVLTLAAVAQTFGR